MSFSAPCYVLALTGAETIKALYAFCSSVLVNIDIPTDTPEKLDYERMARVVGGVQRVVDACAGNVTDSGKDLHMFNKAASAIRESEAFIITAGAGSVPYNYLWKVCMMCRWIGLREAGSKIWLPYGPGSRLSGPCCRS